MPNSSQISHPLHLGKPASCNSRNSPHTSNIMTTTALLLPLLTFSINKMIGKAPHTPCGNNFRSKTKN